MTKWSLFHKCKYFSIFKKRNVNNHTNSLKKKNHTILSIDAEKAFGKTRHSFMIETVNKPETEGNFLNLRKSI